MDISRLYGRINILSASSPSGLCCKETIIEHHHSMMGASPPAAGTGLSACIFLPAAKRIPLQSLARFGSVRGRGSRETPPGDGAFPVSFWCFFRQTLVF
jgi:hypothetical protein